MSLFTRLTLAEKRPFQEEFVPGYDDQDEEWSGKPVKKRKTQLKGKLRKKKPGKCLHRAVLLGISIYVAYCPLRPSS